MIHGRIVIPQDVFMTVCVEHQKLADVLLKLAGQLHRDQAHINTELLDTALEANVALGIVERILKIIADEHLPTAPTSGNGGPGGEPANVQ